MQNLGKWEKTSIFVSLILVVATVIMAINSTIQLRISNNNLRILEHEVKLSQRVILKPFITPDPNNITAGIDLINPTKGEEKWKMGYWVMNDSRNPTYDLRYFHIINTLDSISIPASTELNDAFVGRIIGSGDLVNCGFDYIFRQEVLDYKKNSIDIYRHLYIEYLDAADNTYKQLAKWKLVFYEIGSLPHWVLMERIDLGRIK